MILIASILCIGNYTKFVFLKHVTSIPEWVFLRRISTIYTDFDALGLTDLETLSRRKPTRYGFRFSRLYISGTLLGT